MTAIAVPTRADVLPGQTYVDLVSRYLCSEALRYLNTRGRCSISELADWMEGLFRSTFSDQVDSDHRGRCAKLRLDAARIYAGLRDKATWVLRHWRPDYVDKRVHGGRHGASSGTRKGPSARWTPADLRPFWHLPSRERHSAVISATGMSDSTYYRLAKRMPEFMARQQEQQERQEAISTAMLGLLDEPVDLSENELDSLFGRPGWRGGCVWARQRRITVHELLRDLLPAGHHGRPRTAAPQGDRHLAGRGPGRPDAGQGPVRGGLRADEPSGGAGPGHDPAELAGRGAAAGRAGEHRGAGHPGPADDLRRHPELPHRADGAGEDGGGRVRGPHDAGQLGDRDPGDGRPWWWPRRRDRLPAEAGRDADGSGHEGREPAGAGRDLRPRLC